MSSELLRFICKRYIKGFLEREPYERHWIFGGRRANLTLEEALHEFYKSTWEHMSPDEQKTLAACWVYWILHDVYNVPDRELDRVDIRHYIQMNLTLDENLARLSELLPTLKRELKEYEERMITPEEERIAMEVELERGPLEPKEALKILDEIIDELLSIEDPEARVSAFMAEFGLPRNPPELDGYRNALDAFSYALELLKAQKVQKDKLRKQLERLTKELQITTAELWRIKQRLRQYKEKMEKLPAWFVPAETQPADRPVELYSEKDAMRLIELLEKETGLPYASEYDFEEKVYRIRPILGGTFKSGRVRIHAGKLLTERQLYELSKRAWELYQQLRIKKPATTSGIYRAFREKWREILDLYPNVNKQLETLAPDELETLEKIFTNALYLLDRVEKGEISLKRAIQEYKKKIEEIEEFIRKYRPPEDMIRLLRDPTYPMQLKQEVMREYLELKGVTTKPLVEEKEIKAVREMKKPEYVEYIRRLGPEEIERLARLIEQEFGFRPSKISMVIKISKNMYEVLGFTEIGAPFDIFLKFETKKK